MENMTRFEFIPHLRYLWALLRAITDIPPLFTLYIRNPTKKKNILIKSNQQKFLSIYRYKFLSIHFFYGPIHISNIWNSITARLYSSNSIKAKANKNSLERGKFPFFIVPWVPVPSIIAEQSRSKEKKFTIQIFDINKIK